MLRYISSKAAPGPDLNKNVKSLGFLYEGNLLKTNT